jgi:ABC-type antimicrobial peptide transport system permease subunit
VIVGRPPDAQVRQVVAVVKDSKHRRLDEQQRPAVFIPFLQRYRGDMTLHLRTSGDPGTLVSAVQREVRALDAALPLYNVKTLEQQKSSSLYTSRMAATLLTIFGSLALLLAAVGLYGVMSYSVDRRTREIGIRMALGAQARQVRRLVMVEGLAITTIGLAAGLIAAFAGTRFVESFLYGVAPTDLTAFATGALLLILVALVSNYLPSRRASLTDPLNAIRQ